MYGNDLEFQLAFWAALVGGLAISWFVLAAIDWAKKAADRRLNQLEPRQWNGVGSSLGEE